MSKKLTEVWPFGSNRRRQKAQKRNYDTPVSTAYADYLKRQKEGPRARQENPDDGLGDIPDLSDEAVEIDDDEEDAPIEEFSLSKDLPPELKNSPIEEFVKTLIGKKIVKEAKKHELKKVIKKEIENFLSEQKNSKSIFTVTNESGNDLSSIEEHLDDFLNYSHGKLEFTNPVSVKFISDSDNAQDTLGKTAFYDPAMNEISLYVDNRHPKDVMRSLSHELVHHAQNCRGEFASALQIGEQGYAQKDDHLREMEREAYETGNMVFRDWEDGVHAAAGGEQQASLEEWKRDQINNRLMERFGLTAPKEDISAFRCIINERKTLKTIKEGEEMMTLKDAFEKIRNHPESDRLLALPIQAAIAEIEAVEQAAAGFEGGVEARPELAIAPPGMTKRGTELAMRTDWSRKAKPSSEVPEDLGAVDVPIPSEEEIETVAGEEKLSAEIPIEDEEDDIKEWYYSKLNKRLMENIKRGQ